ncbi:bifunctional phosphopantothenoylcysteine decarboxylase/phosphopantothenate--cysteine ligase CoaBC [Brevundimonas sp. 2R-24]|uniref:Coenzyme A biosynthesis bifunctional protein CoaBC n=1 Tax=Peiella sedimenti TaxID=3061083 RepID=A0ABT8SLI4_9CAUL|nr:bifunctional phosphopantothenoylcysteine decarboxylase/phosphopantothenate--cysteine ligase CoaBC [Caulobacteraceae bacterium XZ-24]
MASSDNSPVRRVLLIVGGGVAAYKTLELVRGLRKVGVEVRAILTEGGAAFVTPLSLAALSGNPVHTELLSLTDEAEMGHIELSRWADLVVVAPATANLMARAANGLADDLATTALLATDKPVMMAPAMNVRMWEHPATRRNLDLLKADGVRFVGPDEGEMACGEYGPGRLAEPEAILSAILKFDRPGQTLAGRRALVTAGPTFEALDPVRGLTNRSSGKQGYAIAAALAARGAAVTLVSGPTALDPPTGVQTIAVESAEDMARACEAAGRVDVAVLAAAVGDWRAEAVAPGKLKKSEGQDRLTLTLVRTPDILARLSQPGPNRPRLVVGFAAETDGLLENARDKRLRKDCDWILANDVSEGRVFGQDGNAVTLITAEREEAWPSLSKAEVAARLADRIAQHLNGAD